MPKWARGCLTPPVQVVCVFLDVFFGLMQSPTPQSCALSSHPGALCFPGPSIPCAGSSPPGSHPQEESCMFCLVPALQGQGQPGCGDRGMGGGSEGEQERRRKRKWT